MKVILIQAFNIKQRPAKKQDTITNCEGSVTYKHLKLMKTKNKKNKQTNKQTIFRRIFVGNQCQTNEAYSFHDGE